MNFQNLAIIGERINPGFRSSKSLFDNEDISGIQDLAIRQMEAGAAYLNINIGEKAVESPEFLKEVIQAVQEVVPLPLSFDSVDVTVQETCLKTYDKEKAKGQKPIINSIAETRWELVEVIKIQPVKVILMASERVEDGLNKANKLSTDVHGVAKRMSQKLVKDYGLSFDDIIIDIAVSAFGTDMEGLTKMAIDGVQLIGEDPDLKGIHMSGGLSNLGQTLPPKAADGSPLKIQLENSFLTLVVPKGFDMVLGTPWKEYQVLAEDNFVFQKFKQILELKGIEAMRVIRKLYRP